MEQRDTFYNRCVSDSMPCSCLYNSSTLLTKSGGLLKILKVSELSIDRDALFISGLRNVISDILYDKRSGCVFYINTVKRTKRREDLTDNSALKNRNYFVDSFFKKYDEQIDENSLSFAEVYISILTKPVNISTKIFSTLFTKNLQDDLGTALKQEALVLDDIVSDVLLKLKSYKIIALNIDNNILSALYKFIAMNEKNIDLDICDVSQSLIKDLNIFFGYNAFEITFNKKKNLQPFWN